MSLTLSASCTRLGMGTSSSSDLDECLCLGSTELATDIDSCQYRYMSKSLPLLDPHAGGESCVCDRKDAFDLTQPTISQQLKVLHEAGLMDRDKRGVWVYYRARTEALTALSQLIA